MSDMVNCPFCGKENDREQASCKYCDAELTPGDPEEAAGSSEEEKQATADTGSAEDQEQPVWEDEFAELDYRPKKKTPYLVSLVTILIAGLIIAAGIYFLRSEEPDPLADPEDNGPELDLPEEEPAEDPDEVVPDEPDEEAPGEEDPDPDDEAELEEETDEEEDEEAPPDYDELEPALVDWLEERLDDPDVIMVHLEELEDTDEFFGKYDLAEDNVIVHRVDSKEEEFASVLFGAPYSEWSIKAVFIWDGSNWNFLREESME